MNPIPRRDRYAEEVARIRKIVERHPLPNFVTGFDVRLGEFDGDPAMWIVFKTVGGGDELVGAEMDRRLDGREALRQAIQTDLLDAVDDRFPYFRFEQEQVGEASSG